MFDHEFEAWENLIWGDSEYVDEYRMADRTCRVCGKKGLQWEWGNGSWYLPHTCEDKGRAAILALRKRLNIGIKREG